MDHNVQTSYFPGQSTLCNRQGDRSLTATYAGLQPRSWFNAKVPEMQDCLSPPHCLKTVTFLSTLCQVLCLQMKWTTEICSLMYISFWHALLIVFFHIVFHALSYGVGGGGVPHWVCLTGENSTPRSKGSGTLWPWQLQDDASGDFYSPGCILSHI